MTDSLELYLITFNCARNFVHPPLLGSHLFHALPENSSLPEVVVLSLQEVAPIAYAFLGGSLLTPYFDRIIQAVELAAAAREPPAEPYKHVFTSNVGMIAMMVFAKPEAAGRMKRIEKGGVGCGLWEMGNKGAVGVRIGYSLDQDGVDESNEEEVQMTFVAAHLAPMEYAVERRNQDWEHIVRNLVFTTSGSKPDSSRPREREDPADTEPLLSNHDADGDVLPYGGIYTPQSHLFVAGDLNYRTQRVAPQKSSHRLYPQPTEPEDSPRHFSVLLGSDQLTHERKTGRTLHELVEMPITFPPTYKYRYKEASESKSKVDTATTLDSDVSQEPQKWLWAPHRYPSWCDRILFLAPGSTSPEAGIYTSLPLQPTSDHQPVALSVSIPLKQVTHKISAPFPINPDWAPRRAAARRKELLVGILAWISMTREGLLVLGLLIAAGILLGLIGRGKH